MSTTPLLAITGFITIAAGLIILLMGYTSAKRKNFNKHRQMMILAVIVLAAFLIQYITRYLIGEETHFEGPNTIRNFVYYPILIVHITFAIICIVLITIHLTRSLKQEQRTESNSIVFPKDYRPKHRRLGRITFSLWLFSYLGGIIIFLMLYVMDFGAEVQT